MLIINFFLSIFAIAAAIFIKKLEKTEVPENNDEPDGFTQEINLKDEPNTMLNVDKDSEVINNSVSDDDDYLDDFFDD